MVTRPEPDASEFAKILQSFGHEAIVEPLMRVNYRDINISLENVEALIFTSRNALRWVVRKGNLRELISLPVFVVGPATASQAKKLGFRQVHEGAGTATGLIDIIQAHISADAGKTIHISGKEVANNILPHLNAQGLWVERIIVYDTVIANTLSNNSLEILGKQQLDGVILMSPKTSKIWVNLIRMLQIEKPPTAFCISSATAEPLKEIKNYPVMIAKKPNIEEMLALIESRKR